MKRTVAFAVLLATLVWPTRSQGQLNTHPVEVQQGIVLRLQDEIGRVTTLTLQNGRTGTVTRPGGPALGLTPTLSDADDGVLVLFVSLVGGAAVKAERQELLGPGAIVHIEHGGYLLDVQWLGTLVSGNEQSLLSPPSECCVVCEGIKTCACKVQASCGSCAAPNCDSSCTLTSPEVRQLQSRPTPEPARSTVHTQGH